VYEGFLRVGRSPLPTIAAVNGAAVGAGMNLALCCDVRLAAERARFDTRFLQLGLHPGGGHTWMLQRLVGPQAARAMVVFGEVLDGRAAERIGLVWRCVPDDELLSAARDLAAKAASAPPKLATKVRQTMDALAAVDDHATAVDVELEPQVWSLDQPDFQERLAALQQRISGKG
jgi:enoyl-CoA hydratase